MNIWLCKCLRVAKERLGDATGKMDYITDQVQKCRSNSEITNYIQMNQSSVKHFFCDNFNISSEDNITFLDVTKSGT